MARGKYASRAATREQATEAVASEAGYKRQVVRLTQERDEARAALAKLRTDSAAEARKFGAQVSAGTSDLVEALRREVNRMRLERDESRRLSKENLKDNDRLFKRLVEHMISQHAAVEGVDAWQQAARLIGVMGDDLIVTVGTEKKVAKSLGVEVVEQLRRARGQQRSAS